MDLSEPSEALLPSYLTFVEELRAAGDPVWGGMLPEGDEDGARFVERLQRWRMEAAAPRVPTTTFWGVEAGQVVGRISVRHELTERTRLYGGHVGYDVRPSARRRGVATAMLALVLQTPVARSLGTLLVTCAPDNVGSRRCIEANGGRLLRIVFVPEVQRQTCHYQIAVGGPASAP